jgi:pyrroloquinoline-quinone synthase
MAISENGTPNLNEAAERVYANTNFLNNPYFLALRDGSMSLEAFQRSQEQFFFAVTFFSRPIAALVARISDPRQRIDILHNLVEEHGDFNEQLFHHTTFQRFLQSIHVVPAKLGDLALWPEVRAFNSVLSASCLLDELEVGVACMGIIEYVFAHVSAEIGRSVCSRGWLNPGSLTHYKLHAEVDCRHAAEFFAVVEPGWSDPTKRYLIEQGLELGAYIFDRLYRDLYGKAQSFQRS